jgi:hypothetical protein
MNGLSLCDYTKGRHPMSASAFNTVASILSKSGVTKRLAR